MSGVGGLGLVEGEWGGRVVREVVRDVGDAWGGGMV